LDKIAYVYPKQPISAIGYNQLVDTANVVNTMTGNVIHGAHGIHIPKQKAVRDVPITYKSIPAMGVDGERYEVGTVVRITGAFGPSVDEAVSADWIAYVCAVGQTDSAAYCTGHIGYGVVTETVAYDEGIGEVAVWGEVPVLVTQVAGQVAASPGYQYAVIDTDGIVPGIPKVYGKLKSGCVASFRVLFEDISGDDLTQPHWALVRVDMGNEIDDQCVSIKSEYTSDIVDGEPVEITGEEDGYLVVDRPSEDSIPAPRILFPVGKIGASTDNPYGFARAGTTPIWVSYTGDDPAIGDEVGTVADSFDFAVGNSGFMCVGVDAANSKCLVRPNSGSGSGGSGLQMVRAVSNGASGVVNVKKVSMLANVAVVPNFELTGDAYSVVYVQP